MKQQRRPSIDIVLCSYNQEEYIGQAVENVLKQKVDAEVRVIVADDCSTDNTLQIIKGYEDKSPFPFVYLDSRENVGMKLNYKRAFAACSSDYVAILEGDDWWHKDNHLAQHVTFLESHRRYSMTHNVVALYHQEDGIIEEPKRIFSDIDHLTIRLRHQIAWGNQIGNLSSCVFRTKWLQALPEEFYRLNYADWELGIMMALRGPIAKFLQETSTYRISSKGLWSALSTEKKDSSIMSTLMAIKPLLPAYCNIYIKSFQKRLQRGAEFPFPMPLKYRLRSLVRKVLHH